MAEVPREIMNHLRAQMYYDRHAATGQNDRDPGKVFDGPEQTITEPDGLFKKSFGRLALGSTEPELSGD